MGGGKDSPELVHTHTHYSNYNKKPGTGLTFLEDGDTSGGAGAQGPGPPSEEVAGAGGRGGGILPVVVRLEPEPLPRAAQCLCYLLVHVGGDQDGGEDDAQRVHPLEVVWEPLHALQRHKDTVTQGHDNTVTRSVVLVSGYGH